MGGAACADFTDDAFYNPASIAKTDIASSRMGYVSWFENMSKMNVFAVSPLRRSNIKLSANLSYFDIGGLSFYDDNGNMTGDFKRNSVDLALSAAANMGKLSLGLTVKGINEKYSSDTGKAFAADVGFIFEFTRSVSIGASMQNVGSKLKIGEVEKELTGGTKAGISIRPSKTVKINVDADTPNDSDTRQHFGAQWEFSKDYYLRGGWQKFGDVSGGTFGFGMKTPTSSWEKTSTSLTSVKGNLLVVDYSYQSNSEFDAIHRFSIGFEF